MSYTLLNVLKVAFYIWTCISEMSNCFWMKLLPIKIKTFVSS